ncbi:MAG: Gfo/Idh/MocA family oxidoreductase [Gammaproteobacteria bacterium]|jgi:predicted dehydrogenase|nr:Gfo/Idh/MocA family oxidoreductase [Gammaproteobacteria bacterium]MBT3861003.1 Gfo/Idh/MocA family oxidoreductase [Gammaproteobacteria bacterium]MBT3986240.1 Gfo/Idh/MocA family oxidoreductase [Gammaproteobacteria bacterium]MBT4256505.1 Gfo/Idh/MocA family oxidoreductase [Gammaproteobacteria bacterium]MBT4582483.1 Gfo/Idh/MocA family oxidoreductase [Gammaproteobacteria bacterium]
MSESNKPRLRAFETAPHQKHIADEDRYLYKSGQASHKLVVIGTGTIGQEHMRVAALLGRGKIHGIFDTSTRSMDVAEENFRKISADPLIRYNDLESACMDPAVDAILICTPNFTHFEVLQTALKSEKPIFLEKPMATELGEAAKIVEIAENYKSFIQIGLQYRYKAQYAEALHEVLSRNTLGEVKTVSMSEYRPPFLDKVKQWNKFNEFSGGTLVEKCCHYFDLINLMADSKPIRVYASGGQASNFLDLEIDGRKSDIDDHAFVVIDYENEVRANFTLNMFCADFSEELIVTGNNGRILASEKSNFQQQGPHEATLQVELGEQGASRSSQVGYPRLVEQSGHHGATFYEHIVLMDRLENKRGEGATPLQGLWAMIVASAAQESVVSKQAVEIDEFVDRHQLSSLAR